MIKAGLIGAAVGIIYVMGLTMLSPFCPLCFIPLLGLGVGYLAGRFDTPQKSEISLYRGALAGGIAGVGAALGQMLATVVNAILVTNSEQLPLLLQEFGLSEFMIADPHQYWQATLIINSLCSLFNLLLLAGLGAVGARLWFRRRRRTLISTTLA
ncbi:MAG: hypothetical protein AB1801_19640 [Chloroflexota bacterium]